MSQLGRHPAHLALCTSPSDHFANAQLQVFDIQFDEETTAGVSTTKRTLEQLGFFDDPLMYVVSMQVLKNFICLGDIRNSMHFVNWREADNSLQLLARDRSRCDVMASGIMLDDGGGGVTVGMLVSDDLGNLRVMQYRPDLSQGKTLNRAADFHLGTPASTIIPVKSKRALIRTASHFGSLDGSAGVIVPTDERPFKRLYALQGILINALPVRLGGEGYGGRWRRREGEKRKGKGREGRGGKGRAGNGAAPPTAILSHASISYAACSRYYHVQPHAHLPPPQHVAALNPRAHRLAKQTPIDIAKRQKKVLDGALLWRFVSLDLRDQTKLCLALGTTVEAVLRAMLEIDHSISLH